MNIDLKELEFLKKEFYKRFRDELSLFIEKMLNNEMLFYGFTINFPLYHNAEQAWSKIDEEIQYYISRLTEIDLIEFVYITIEKHEARQIKRETNIKSLDSNLVKSLYGYPHIHGTIALRSLLGKQFGKEVRINLKETLNLRYRDLDLQFLNRFKGNNKNFYSVKKWWEYSIKENNFANHKWFRFSRLNGSFYNNFLDMLYVFHAHKINWLTFVECYGLYNNINSINRLLGNDVDSLIILYLLYTYCITNDCYIYNMKIIQRKENTRYSWKVLYNLVELKENIFAIYNELQLKFKIQLSGININGVLLSNINKAIYFIKDNLNILPCKPIKKEVIEFKDGLYFLDSTYFFRFVDNKSVLDKLDIGVLKSYNKYYNRLKNKLPNLWLKLLSAHLDENELIDFCSNLGYYFNCTYNIISKQKTVCIVGDTNTGKSLLIANILQEAIGSENMGIISNFNNNFMFEHIENKELIICDEFKYTENSREDLLKILNNQPILINAKYERLRLYENNIPVIFLFNNSSNNKLLDYKAFISRLIIYTFTKALTLDKPFKEIKQILSDELPQIIVYCNNLYFKKYDKNELREMRRISRNSFLNKSENITSISLFGR